MMLWVGPDFGLEFLLVMALAGGALAVMAIVPVFGFVWQWALMRTGLGGLFVPQTGPPSIPYGVAISVAGTFVLYGKYLGHL
jgi:Flp pilus assembly protein protease CpaA